MNMNEVPRKFAPFAVIPLNEGKQVLVNPNHPEDTQRVISGEQRFTLLEYEVIDSLRASNPLGWIARLHGMSEDTLKEGLAAIRGRLDEKETDDKTLIQLIEKKLRNGNSQNE